MAANRVEETMSQQVVTASDVLEKERGASWVKLCTRTAGKVNVRILNSSNFGSNPFPKMTLYKNLTGEYQVLQDKTTLYTGFILQTALEHFNK